MSFLKSISSSTKSTSNSLGSLRTSEHFAFSNSLRSNQNYIPWRESACAEIDWKLDNDKISQLCDVKVVSRAIGSTIGNHVAMFFDWGSKQALYEAGDVGGSLVPTWSKGPLSSSKHEWKVDEAYQRCISPHEVNRNAIDLVRSGRYYDVVENNCYWWVLDLAKKFQIEINFSVWAALSFIPGIPVIVDGFMNGSKGSIVKSSELVENAAPMLTKSSDLVDNSSTVVENAKDLYLQSGNLMQSPTPNQLSKVAKTAIELADNVSTIAQKLQTT